MGGLNLIKSYISRGQNTLYFQKFNVVYSPYYSNQYAQNVLDSQSIGTILKGYYRDANLLDSSFTFIIPLYHNMPSEAVKSPTITTETGEIAHINANGGLALHSSPNGPTIAYVNNGTQVLILERAFEKLEGYYWDKVSTPKGTGYMAREAKDGSKIYLVTGNSVNIVSTEKFKVDGENIFAVPGAVIEDIPGATNLTDKFGTGSKITIEGTEYTLVMVGDANGDGNITPADYVKVKNKIMGVTSMEAVNEKAADVNRDGNITPADYVKIKNHIMSVSRISI